MKTKSILVTGHMGFIGGNFVKKFRANNPSPFRNKPPSWDSLNRRSGEPKQNPRQDHPLDSTAH
jgi:nucleoside-diphosphate-sugar epimerase